MVLDSFVYLSSIMFEEWEWFCGKNNSDLTKDPSAWTSNTCFVNGLTALLHAAFLVVFSMVLLLVVCFSKSLRSIKTKYLLLYPGHTGRWLVSLASLLVLAATTGEGVITDGMYRAWHHPTQPHLYVPGAISFVAMVLSLIYNHHMELWQTPSMAILLGCYWALALAGEGIRLVNLRLQNQIDVHVLRFDLTMVMLIFFGALFLNEVNLMRIKVSLCQAPKYVLNKGGYLVYSSEYSTKANYKNWYWADIYWASISPFTFTCPHFQIRKTFLG